MQIYRIESADLFTALKRCEKAVTKRATIPVLSKVLVEFNNSARFVTTDLGTQISSTCPLTTAESCSETFLAPFTPLYKAAQALKSFGELVIGLDKAESTVFLRAGRREYSFPVDYETADFPSFVGPAPDMPLTGFSTSGDNLIKVLKSVSAAMCLEETRYYLNGIYFDGSVNPPVIVATDGNRLHLRDLQCTKVNDICNMKHIVSAATIDVLVAIAKDADDVVVRFDDKKVYFDCASFSVVSELIDGTFPEYARVIPRPDLKWIKIKFDTVPVIDFLKTARAAILESSKDSVNIIVNETFSIVATSDNATLRQEFSAEGKRPSKDSAVEVSFNCKYLVEALDGLETAELHIIDDIGPALILSPDLDWRRVIMPCRR